MSGFSRRQFDFDIHSGLMSAPPETRTFFTSSATWERRAILQSHNLCDLLLEVIRANRAKHRLQVHEFCLHARPHSLNSYARSARVAGESRAVHQGFIKGGFSYRAKRELNYNGEIWQKGYNERRIRDASEYAAGVEYIWMNPVKAGMVSRPDEYPYSSARLRGEVDPAPPQFQATARG